MVYKKRSIRAVLAPIVVLLVLAGATPGSAQQKLGGPNSKPPEPAEPKKQPAEPDISLVRPGPAPTMSLMYTGDVIGYLEPCG